MVYKKIHAVIGHISEVFGWVSAAAMIAMSLVSGINVFMRYVLKSPWTGAEELVQVSLAVFVYAALSLAIRKGTMTSVPVIAEKLKPRARNIMNAIGNICVAVVSAFVMYELTISLTTKFSNVKRYATTILRIPEAYIYLLVVICYVLITIELLLKATDQIMEAIHPTEPDKNAETEMEEIESEVK